MAQNAQGVLEQGLASEPYPDAPFPTLLSH